MLKASGSVLDDALSRGNLARLLQDDLWLCLACTLGSGHHP